MKKRLLWFGLPAAFLLLLLAGLVLALPGFVASGAHRAAIESFVSSLTGSHVRIGGKLSLTLLPQPRLTATEITITGPAHQTVTAQALAMDISLPALLHGQLKVQTLNLVGPHIGLPWPPPGGASGITPPPWLATLHAHLQQGTLQLGALTLTHVNADLFTGQGGALSVAGGAVFKDHPLTLSLALGKISLAGAAPISIQAESSGNKADFSGQMDDQGLLTGHLALTLANGLTGDAALTVDKTGMAASALNFRQGKANLGGSASLAFAGPTLSASLIGQNLNLGALQTEAAAWPANIPATIGLAAKNITLNGQSFPALQANLTSGADGVVLHHLTLTLPGGASLSAHGAVSPKGALSGQASLTAPDLAALLSAWHLPPEPDWPAAQITAALAGSLAHPALHTLSGTLGNDHVTGNLVLSAGHASGTLAFDHLALAPLASWVSQEAGGPFTADGALTAANATAGPVKLQHLALDAALDGTLNIRRASADLYGGLAAGSVTLDSHLQMTAAHGFLDIPSAAPLAALLPAAWHLPPALLKPRLTLNLAAQGPPTSLAASIVGTLGDFTITATPVVDLAKRSANGALSLQTPNAIAAMKLFGLNKGLAFPGPGSISLRARFTAAPGTYGFNDFVLSLGALTANGRLLAQNGTLGGRITASTLAIPPLPPGLRLPTSWPAALHGTIDLSANRVLYAGAKLLGPSTASLAIGTDGATLKLKQAALAGGTLAGSLTAKLNNGKPPALTANLLAQNLDAAALDLPFAFPFPLHDGRINATATLNATGFTPDLWAATLGGTVALNASNGHIGGFDLARLASTLPKHSPAALRAAMNQGRTPFATLSVAGTLAQGNATLTQAHLSGPKGTASATGGIDLYDRSVALRVNLQPAITPKAQASLLAIGPWPHPRRVADITKALGWKPPAPATPLPLPPPPAPPAP